MKTRQYTHDNRIIKQVICLCSFSAFMPFDKLHSVHASLQNDIINQGHMLKTAHTHICRIKPTIQHLCAKNTEYMMLSKKAEHPPPKVLSHTHTPTLMLCRIKLSYTLFYTTETWNLSAAVNITPFHLLQSGGSSLKHSSTFSPPQPTFNHSLREASKKKIPCYVAPSSGDCSRQQKKSSRKSVDV